jgi:MFS family permease
VHVGRLIRQPAVALYLTSTVCAALGVNILVTVLFKQAYDITGDELTIGLLGLAQFVPAVALVLVSGWAADRFDRRHVTALFLVGRALCAVALLAVSVGRVPSQWVLLAIALVFGASDAMLGPARRSITPLIATTQDLPHVVALWTAAFTGAAIVGPVLGGFLYSAGPAWSYGIAAGLELAAVPPILLLRYLRRPERITSRPTWATAMEGLHFVRATPVVLAAISLDLFAVLFGGAVALIAPVAEERLGVGDVGYGFLRAAPGIGAALMAVVLAVRPIRRRVGPTLLVVVAIFGAGTIVFGLTRNYALAFAALVVISAADMVSMYIRGSLVPLATPDEQLGRVTAVESVFIGASNELGAFESGVAARAFGLPWSIAGGGAITVLIAASFWFWFPTVRGIDTFGDVEHDRPHRQTPEPA